MGRTMFEWRKSSYSSNTGACVEVARVVEQPPQGWRKSSYSGNQGGHCVEVAETASRVHVRDTQNRDLGHLTFPGSDWSSLLASLREDGAAG